MIAIFRNWTYALFYTLANLWGSVVVSLLFWGFANEITTVDEVRCRCVCVVRWVAGCLTGGAVCLRLCL